MRVLAAVCWQVDVVAAGQDCDFAGCWLVATSTGNASSCALLPSDVQKAAGYAEQLTVRSRNDSRSRIGNHWQVDITSDAPLTAPASKDEDHKHHAHISKSLSQQPPPVEHPPPPAGTVNTVPHAMARTQSSSRRRAIEPIQPRFDWPAHRSRRPERQEESANRTTQEREERTIRPSRRLRAWRQQPQASWPQPSLSAQQQPWEQQR